MRSLTRTILTLTLAAAIALFTAGPAAAECTTNTVFVNGTMLICTTCCAGSHCFSNGF